MIVLTRTLVVPLILDAVKSCSISFAEIKSVNGWIHLCDADGTDIIFFLFMVGSATAISTEIHKSTLQIHYNPNKVAHSTILTLAKTVNKSIGEYVTIYL